ncbi:lysophospholipase [Sphingomonas sp. RB56-2]|uniref:Lysophospholipase n=1 Tax=Sphingomonas brevis TaxID=2908206 RepID=A0ABT0S9P5_9SPHN|nr:alpha/beta fold hydrolase [Sphingomonas brevis]MCL6741108.1 lysophospholipase [Sphingomonas brevis]
MQRSILLFILIGLCAPAASAEPVWSASATTSTRSEEKLFENGGTKLAGTLVLPKMPGKVPVAVILHGASSPLRSEVLYDHLKRMLPALGIAVFSYDRRGTGRSGGVARGNDYELLADDGIAAARMLAQDPRIDANRIGFWGLSQGGWLSLLAASKYGPTAFAISVSAPMVTPDAQMNFAVANIMRIKGFGQADIDLAIAARTAVDEFERGRLDRPTAQARVDEAASKPWFDLIYLDRTFGDPDKSGWAKEIRHDPLASIGAIRAPTLIIYGSSDPWVPAARSMDRLRAFTQSHRNFETVVVGGADHAMMTTATPQQQIDPAFFPQQAPDSAEYFARLATWLQKQGLTN